MRGKKHILSCYGNSQKIMTECFRPESPQEFNTLIDDAYPDSILGRGRGLSYSDVCLNDNVILTDRLNHFIHFDGKNLSAQPGVTLFEILTLCNEKSLAVIPGTLRATLGGAVANDVHGKNNPKEGNIGHHVKSIKLVLPEGRITTSPEENEDLFYATIGGLGLTGFIEEVSIELANKSKAVRVKTKSTHDILELFSHLLNSEKEYAVCWLDLINRDRFVLMEAEHINQDFKFQHKIKKIPFTLPINLIYEWNIKWFNQFYFNRHQTSEMTTDIVSYNNPLDTIYGWDRIYGPKGMVQFQCLFPFEDAPIHYEAMLKIIDKYQATPILAVLKKFTQFGKGLLSFTQPGFSLAVDFVNYPRNIKAIKELNAYLTEINGKVYLAKDSLLTKNQFEVMYKNIDQFKNVLERYKINNQYQSQLSKRLGITL